jgi:aspartate racemase
MMVDAARGLEASGAGCLLICTNTMHKMAAEVQAAVDIPLLHIGDAIASAVHDSGATRPLLLATRFAMEQDFYLGYLRERHGIHAVVPEELDRMEVHRVIYEELCQGKVIASSKQTYMQIIDKARSDADLPADSVIFGCTEIGLLITPDDFSFPAFDTTVLHAEAALTFAGY